MKKLIIVVAMLVSVVAVNAQNDSVNVVKESVKISGNITFKSMSNSTLTGGFFSQNPALSATITASYRNASLAISRNSDLLDPTTGANVFAFLPSYTKTFGKYAVNTTIEVDFFDQTKDINLIAPELTISRKGVVEVDLFLCYARTFTSHQDIYIARGSVSKSYQGFTFRAYAWYVNWGVDKISFAGEISKEIAPKLRVSVFGHLNNVNLPTGSEFGAVRIGYSF
ncbi:MAG: hypothetical protein LBD11_00305 [Candidatus Peribacteria bacterium]|jgi:hypothetical protein|nr:hypothetical protein [Candidatus Peribacteria bacterium]